ncbi:hypothetical protein BH24ACT5_BH24ACT5_05810 [soil metagenome]
MSIPCRRPPDGADLTTAPIPAPLEGPEDALTVIDAARHRPERPEAIVLLLDEHRQGRIVVVVDDAEPDDAALTVVDCFARAVADSGRPGCLVVATVRPGGAPGPDDADLWLEASARAEELDCELVEWFVIADDVVWCPRDLLAEPPRWNASQGRQDGR